MNLRRFVLLAGLVLVVMLIDVLWLATIPGAHVLINLTLLTVIALTIGERLVIGLGAAVIAGAGFTLFSALSGPVYFLAFLGAAGGAWLFSRKIVTTRSGVSFLTTIIVGTVVYAVILLGTDSTLSLLNRERLHLTWSVLLLTTLVQSIVHPIVLSIVWRLFGRHQYHHVPKATAQSF